MVLLIFLGCAQANGQPLIHVCLCFVLLFFHFWPCLQLLTDKLVRQCKWVWPARLGEGRGRGNQQNPVPGPTIPHTLLLRNIFFFNCANRSQWFLFSFFLRSHKDSFKLQIMDNLYFFSFIFDLSSSFFFSSSSRARGKNRAANSCFFFLSDFLVFFS